MKRRKIHIQKRFFVRAGVDRKVLGKESSEERKKTDNRECRGKCSEGRKREGVKVNKKEQ